VGERDVQLAREVFDAIDRRDVVRAASGVPAVPLEELPSPSGVHTVPDLQAR